MSIFNLIILLYNHLNLVQLYYNMLCLNLHKQKLYSLIWLIFNFFFHN